MPYKLTFEDGSDGYLAQAELDPKEVERRRYAFPEERKFPLTDASKVMSAIKFFNYVDPKNERHLANAILKRMKELGISEVNVGPNNRFKKYYEAQNGYLEHFGVKGMHWGVWNEETRARRLGLHNDIRMSSEDYQKRLRSIGYSETRARQITEARDWYKKAAIGALTVAAVVGVAAIGSYAVRKYGVKTLKAGKVLQTVHVGDIGERVGKQSFYASYTKADNAIYRGYFGKTGANVTKLAARQDIKIAPEARAHKIFVETVKQNPHISYEENGVTHITNFNTYLRERGINPEAAKSIRTYRAFNHDLVHKSKPVYNAAHDAFYTNMKAQGFGALTDSYNAFGAHGYSYRPIIVFGDVKFDVSKQTVVKASSRAKNRYIAAVLSTTRPNETLAMELGAIGASVAAMVGVSENKVRARENFAKQYRKDHPNTNKTDAQLKRMYDSENFFESDPYV